MSLRRQLVIAILLLGLLPFGVGAWLAPGASPTTTALATVGVAFLAWVIAALVFLHRIGGAARLLETTARRVAGGDYAPMSDAPAVSREFTELHRAFAAMLTRLTETRQALDAQMAEERRMREELQLLQGQIIRQERLAAVGQLVSGVAHEINNPLQAIIGFTELLQQHPEMPSEARADLDIIYKEGTRASGIIRRLALFARQQTGESTSMALSDVMQTVAELRRPRLASAAIELVVDDRLTASARSVPGELQQVVLNFVVNAEQAILDSGRLPGRITIRAFARDDATVLEVEDTGPGVTPEHEARLFQPFFTTKPVGEGTGLGLSVSYGILASLGGRIGYRRAAGGGAIFFCELPASDTPPVVERADTAE